MSRKQIIKQFGEQREQELWDERLERFGHLARLKAPRIVILLNCFILLNHHGMRESLWFWFRMHYWTHWKTNVWLYWQKYVRRRTPQEIENLVLGDDYEDYDQGAEENTAPGS